MGVVSAARVRARGMTRLFFTCRGGDPDRARQRPARAMQCVVWGDPARRSGPDIIERDKRGDHNEPTQRPRHDCNDWHRTCLVSGARFRPGSRLRTGDERTQHLHERRRGTRAPGRSSGARQAPFARHPGVNDLWIGIAAWPRGAALHPRARRKGRDHDRGLGAHSVGRPTLRSPTASWRMRMRPTIRTTPGRRRGGQPRHPRHLPAAHDCCDAGRQDRVLSSCA